MAKQASWIREKHARVVLEEAQIPTPGDDEVLVKVEVIAFSPIESKLQSCERRRSISLISGCY